MTDKEIITWWNGILDDSKEHMLSSGFYFCCYFDYMMQHNVVTCNICSKCPFRTINAIHSNHSNHSNHTVNGHTVSGCPVWTVVTNNRQTKTKYIIVVAYLINEFRKFDIVTWYRENIDENNINRSTMVV